MIACGADFTDVGNVEKLDFFKLQLNSSAFMESAGSEQKYTFIVIHYYAQCTFSDQNTNNTAHTFKLNLHFEYFSFWQHQIYDLFTLTSSKPRFRIKTVS